MDLAVGNTELLDIWWNMLITLSKQIANTLAKIIHTKVNTKPCQTSEMKLFSQVVTDFRGYLSSEQHNLLLGKTKKKEPNELQNS